MVLATVLSPAFHATGDWTRSRAGRAENDMCTDNVQKDAPEIGTANLRNLQTRLQLKDREKCVTY